MAMNNPYQSYKQNSVNTASPGELTLMLYNGCLKFIDEGVKALEEKQYEQANNSLIKAENIISEFRVTLNMEYEIAQQLMPLYNYAYDRLVEGNLKSDVSLIRQGYDIIHELRDAWMQAMKKARVEQGTQNVQGDSYVG